MRTLLLTLVLILIPLAVHGQWGESYRNNRLTPVAYVLHLESISEGIDVIEGATIVYSGVAFSVFKNTFNDTSLALSVERSWASNSW